MDIGTAIVTVGAMYFACPIVVVCFVIAFIVAVQK